MNEQSKYSLIPKEMREASLGSFPLSPGVMSGHYDTAYLYWYYRQQLLQQATIIEVFGTDHPEPIPLTIPKGHTTLTSPEGLNKSVWNYFLDTSFSTRPQVTGWKKLEI